MSKISRKTLEKLALGYCVLVLLGAAWFWSRQVESVIELLRIAYG